MSYQETFFQHAVFYQSKSLLRKDDQACIKFNKISFWQLLNHKFADLTVHSSYKSFFRVLSDYNTKMYLDKGWKGFDSTHHLPDYILLHASFTTLYLTWLWVKKLVEFAALHNCYCIKFRFFIFEPFQLLASNSINQ